MLSFLSRQAVDRSTDFLMIHSHVWW